MKVLDAKTALSLMAYAVLREGGDHVYTKPTQTGWSQPACAYLDAEDNRSCLVGHVLRDFGMPAELIRASGNTKGINSFAVELPGQSEEFGIDSLAVRVLMGAQDVQDEGETWGDALAQAVLTFLDLSDSESMGS